MKKGCVDYNKSTSSERSVKNLFIAKELIDDKLNILDVNNFRIETTKQTQRAKELGIDKGRLFTERTISIRDQSYFQAVPNKEAFNAIDNRNSPSFKKDVDGETIVSREVMVTIADKLKAKLGVDYKIVSSEEAKKIINKPSYNGKDPFFFNNKVYIIEGEFTLETPIHEFSHAFVRAIIKKNPTAFNNVMGEIMSTSEGTQIYEKVRKLYPEDFNGNGSPNNKALEEIAVRAITEVAKKNINPETGGTFLAAVKRLFLQLKQALRDVFGKEIKVAELNENTTLQELADMLTVGKGKLNLHSNKGVTYGSYELVSGMPFQDSTIERLQSGEQGITIRQTKHKSGIYIINGKKYHIENLGLKNGNDFQDKQALKADFKGETYESGKYKHIDEFFEGEKKLYVYQITALDKTVEAQNVSFKKSLELKDEKKIEEAFKNEPAEKPEQVESAFEKQYTFFVRRLKTLKKMLEKHEESTPEYASIAEQMDALEEKLEIANEQQSREAYVELGMDMLTRAEDFIKSLEEDPAKVSKKNLLFVINTLATFNDFEGLSDTSKRLFRRAYPFLSKHTLEVINKYSTEGFEITQEMIDKQTSDIGKFTASVGALADLANYIARTIGSIIKAAQNRASRENKELLTEVQSKVNGLIAYAKDNNMTLDQVYDLLITETEDNLKLIAPHTYTNGIWKENPNFKIVKDNKALLDFYSFYRKTLTAAESNLPYKVGKHYIPNIHKSDIKYKLTHLIDKHDVLFDQFKSNEGLYADIVPEQFRGKIPKEKKSRDLGASLLEFTAYSNVYNALSETLPEARLLQEQLNFKQLSNGEVKLREFTKSSDASVRINFDQTNLKKMVNTVIDMQLKGEMTKKEGAIKVEAIKDSEGNITGYQQVYASDVVDMALKYNSLLRIGLSPVTAVANVLFGDVSNVIEAVGGRFFGVKDLHHASTIFFKQINYNPNSEDKSEIHKWLEKLNPLQELDDYNLSDSVKLEKMSPEKLQEYMYAMQKKGELFLQSRTMLAVLIKEGYMNSNGETTKEGKELMENDSKLEQLSDKIQRLNQMIHGRYSRREAAAMQQSVIYRAMIQFRKWIPAAIENRLGKAQYDNRLGVDIEGRYRTLARLVGTKEVFTNLIKLSKGELSEVEMYNMKKNLTELVILAASILSYALLFGGDEDEDKKRRKQPGVKMALTLLDRISGDLEFFYNPTNVANIAGNTVPLAKLGKDLIKTFTYIPHAFYYGEWEYKKGSLKGSNKFWANAKKNMIGFKPFQDVQKLLNDNPLDEFK